MEFYLCYSFVEKEFSDINSFFIFHLLMMKPKRKSEKSENVFFPHGAILRYS